MHNNEVFPGTEKTGSSCWFFSLSSLKQWKKKSNGYGNHWELSLKSKICSSRTEWNWHCELLIHCSTYKEWNRCWVFCFSDICEDFWCPCWKTHPAVHPNELRDFQWALWKLQVCCCRIERFVILNPALQIRMLKDQWKNTHQCYWWKYTAVSPSSISTKPFKTSFPNYCFNLLGTQAEK